jgi:drug/metabolite transporter (DMT)-like permease
VTVFWGATYVVNQSVMTQLSPADLLTWRFGVAALILILLRPHWILTAPRVHFIHGFWLGAILGTGFLVQLIGLTTTSATASGFITGMFVVFVPLLAAVMFRERITSAAWIGVSMAFVGLALIAFNGLAVGLGEALTLLCALLFAFHIIGLDRWVDAEYLYTLTTAQVITVFLLSLSVSVAQGGPRLPPTPTIWLAILLMAVVGTCIGYFAQTWVQSQLSSTRTAIILTMEPVFAGLAGVTVGTDVLTPRIVVGSLLILAATYVVELGPRQSAEGEHIRLEP